MTQYEAIINAAMVIAARAALYFAVVGAKHAEDLEDDREAFISLIDDEWKDYRDDLADLFKDDLDYILKHIKDDEEDEEDE